MALWFAFRLVLSMPFFALVNAFDLLAHFIAGIRRVVSIEINAHPSLGYGVVSTNPMAPGAWREDIHEAAAAACFIINQAADRLADDLQRAVPHETE